MKVFEAWGSEVREFAMAFEVPDGKRSKGPFLAVSITTVLTVLLNRNQINWQDLQSRANSRSLIRSSGPIIGRIPTIAVLSFCVILRKKQMSIAT